MQIVGQAMVELRPLFGRFHERDRLFCPLAVGRARDVRRVFAWQFDGETRSGETLPDWRCFALDELAGLRLVEGRWRCGGAIKGYRQACLEVIELAVAPEHTTADLSAGSREN